jgi:hypothetical protein
MGSISFLEVVVTGIGLIMPIIGYFLKSVLDEVEQHRNTLAALHEVYVKKDDFTELKKDMKEGFNRIEAKLDKMNGK